MDNSLLKKFILILFSLMIIITSAKTFLEKAEIYYFNGKSAFQTRDYKSAEKYFEEALKLSSQIETKYPDIRYMLGWSKFHLRKYTEAEKYLKDFTDDPKVRIALESIESGNIQKDLHFESLKIKSTIESTKATTNNLKISTLYYIIVAFVIFLITAILAALFYFLVLKKYSFAKTPTEKISEKEELFEEEDEEEVSVPIEDILEVKIDELEELWGEYENIKNKMDIEEEEASIPKELENNQTMETTVEELDVDNLLNEPINENEKTEKINMDIDDILDETKENENNDTEKVDNIEGNEDIEPPEEEIIENSEINELSDMEENLEEKKETENEKMPKDEKVNLDSIETIKPTIDAITKYNKIMNEPEGSIVISEIKGLENLNKIDEEISKKGGQYSKGDLHSIFKEIFAEKNRDSVMLE